LQGLEILDPGLDFRKLRKDQLLQARTQVLAAPGVRKGGDLPNARQGKADLLGTTDELEALEVPVRVYPMP
jgi:hypothetical protein